MKKIFYFYLWISLLMGISAYLFPVFAQNHPTHENSEVKGTFQKIGKAYLRVAAYQVEDVFWCPMDCEKQKLYKIEGTCPKCTMDLIPQQGCYLEIFLFYADKKSAFTIPSSTFTVEVMLPEAPIKIILQSTSLNREKREISSHFAGMAIIPQETALLTLKGSASFGPKDDREATLEVKIEKLIPYPLDYCLLHTEKKLAEDPVVLIYEGYEFKFCSTDSTKDFKDEPKKYLQLIASIVKSQASKIPISAPTQTENNPYLLDYCIICEEKLGSMGEPVVLVHEGQEVKFCCADCIKTFTQDPEKYLNKIAEAYDHK